MAYLRIVLLGQYWSGKSSSGNTIVGESVFKVGVHRSVQSVRYGEAAGRHLTVVDSPGWNYNKPLDETPEMDKLEIQNSVCLCPPGPHAALLMVPLHEAFTEQHRVALEEYMSLLSQNVWSHTIVLFTFGDHLGDRGIEQHIEAAGEHLRWLVDKCGNRYHVFNNEKREDTQVRQLLEKIEEMVAGNGGGHYEVDGDVAERKRNMEEHVLTLMTKTHRHRAILKALFEGEHQSLPDLRLMLVGGDLITKTWAGGHILQEEFVFTGRMPRTESVIQQRRVADRNVSVVVCPDWSTTPPPQKIKDALLRGLTLCSPGPHAVLLNVPVPVSFSEADKRSVEEHMELLGDRVWRHTLVLFTCGVWLGKRRVEEYIEAEGEPLRGILEKCGYRYHVLDFRLDLDISEVKELVEKVEDMVTRNRGHFGPSETREGSSVRDTGHLGEGQETRQKTPFERLKGKKTLTDKDWKSLEEEWKREREEWRRREEEWRRRVEELMRREEKMIEKILQFVETEPTLPPVRRRMSKIHVNPSMSGGTPSEAGSSFRWSPDKVYDWLQKRHAGPIASSTSLASQPSSGYGSEAASQLDVMSVRDEDESMP